MQVLRLILVDREQSLRMSDRQVRPLLECFVTCRLKDQAAASLLDLREGAAAGLVRKVALKHALASPLLLDQTHQRRSNDEQALHRHAVNLTHKLLAGCRPALNIGHNNESDSGVW